MGDVVVVGAGPAGMMAAIAAAREGAGVTVFDRNRLPGRKLLLTGKGRCNLTNDTDADGIISGLPGNGRFLTGAIHRFPPHDLMAMVEGLGVPLKVERGRRVFPASDRSNDIVRALKTAMTQSGAVFHGGVRVADLVLSDGSVHGVRLADGRLCRASAVIVATGGRSYPATGCTGDGYRMAASAGHSVVEPLPALVPLETAESWVSQLQGLSLKNVNASLYRGEKAVGNEFGEMLFTHFGVSGPLVLSLSREAVRLLKDGRAPVSIGIDLKPALDRDKLDARVQRDFADQINRQFKNALGGLLPHALVPVIVMLSGIDGECPVNQISRERRLRLVDLLKDLRVTVKRPRPIDEAIVTAGGVSTKEIDPRTMESRLVKGLFFAGELLDVDGYTGGYNLQAAFSSGYVAGISAAAIV